jgi:hypothetical protein
MKRAADSSFWMVGRRLAKRALRRVATSPTSRCRIMTPKITTIDRATPPQRMKLASLEKSGTSWACASPGARTSDAASARTQ